MRSLESRDVIQRHKAALGGGVDGGVPVESLSRAVLDEAVPNAAGAMRWALAQVGTDAVVPLSTGLRSAEPAVRRNAIRALDEIRRTASADDVAVATAVAVPMQEALDDDDLEVRTVAALALGDMRDPVAVPILLEVAMSDEKDIDATEALASYFAEVPPAGGANAPSRDEVEVPVDGVEVPVVDGAGAATGEDTGEPTGDSVGASIMARRGSACVRPMPMCASGSSRCSSRSRTLRPRPCSPDSPMMRSRRSRRPRRRPCGDGEGPAPRPADIARLDP